MNEMRKLMNVTSLLTEDSHTIEDLDQAIRSGEIPTIHNASSVSYGWAWGDLIKLGYARRKDVPVGDNEMERSYHYLDTAPGSIKLVTVGKDEPEIMNPGDSTDPVTWDPT
jgi:hypothetical protein